MFRLVSMNLVFFEESENQEAEIAPPWRLLEGNTDLTALQGAVASACADPGHSAASIFLVTDVSGRVPLSTRQNITPVVEGDGTAQAGDHSRSSHDDGPGEYYRSVSLHCLSSRMRGANCSNHTCYFSLDIVSTDFDPYPRDCVQVVFSSLPDTQSRKVLSVKPRGQRHVREVRITNINGRNGVIDHTTFFTLDSVKLPDGYMPQIHDVVNAVVVESILAGYICRAVLITPCE